MQTKEEYISLIIKKLNTEISTSEEKSLETWLNSNSDNKAIYDSYAKDWNSVSSYKTSFKPNKKLAWAKIESQLSKETTTKVVAITSAKKWYRVVATVILLLGVSFFVKNFVLNSNYITEQTANNETKSIVLPDGSSVTINKNSSIKYAKNFVKRDIELKGEAFFDVKKDIEHPFIVNTENTSTQVLGTVFNIDANNLSNIEVALISGKVKFSNNNNSSVILNPGEIATYSKATATITKRKIDTENNIAWKTKKLVFENTPISKIVSNLEDYYNVDINLKSTENNCHFTGTFNSAKVDDVLQVLSFSLNTTYKLSNGKYQLEKFSCE